MSWYLSHRTDVDVRRIADRHYNRQSIGAPGFVPPGRCLVLRTATADAFWVTSYPFAEYVKHRWAGAWVCSAFRNEGGGLSSAMILDALRITAWKWPAPRVPTWVIVARHRDWTEVARDVCAMVTFVDEGKTRKKRDPGRCYRRAGFEEAGRTKAGLLALVMRTAKVPAPMAPMRFQTEMAW